MKRVVTELTIMPDYGEIYADGNIEVSVSDIGGGLFVSVVQSDDNGICEIQINPKQWSQLRMAIDEMFMAVKNIDNGGTE